MDLDAYLAFLFNIISVYVLCHYLTYILTTVYILLIKYMLEHSGLCKYGDFFIH